ncbi:MAG TPA: Na+/H+ antiporter NhaA [Nevskiales bacterium]|nr:Na+/H+ antiporter NhaA [Nevskiales bacterium]
MSHTPSAAEARLPTEPIDRLVDPIARFLHIQAASGVVLLLFTLAPLVLANSSWSGQFLAFWKTPLGFSIGSYEVNHSLKHWINDGLMVIFFFVVGLEVKRELAVGELRSLRLAALPVAAALGGMLAPATLYLALQWGEPGMRGWAIPMATDIAFVVGCLALLGERVPHSLRILLLSLAIVDDIGAILVIAIGYTDSLNLRAMGFGLAGIAVVMLMARLGVRSVLLYTVVGIGIWFAFHESGVHATIAGVILGLLTPVRPWIDQNLLVRYTHRLGDFLHGDSAPEPDARHALLRSMERAARETLSPLERIEATLHPWVGFVVMPLFAFANAGVVIEPAAFRDAIALAVAAGLVIGKPVGIVLLSWLAVRLGLAALPAGVGWGALAAGGVLAGIGFTMALFIAGLAFEGTQLDAAKIGVLAASALCATAGMLMLLWLLPKPPPEPAG